MKKRPEFCTDEHLEYLDELRESGDTNMWGAAAYLHSEFGNLTSKEAREVLFYWMDSFAMRHPRDE